MRGCVLALTVACVVGKQELVFRDSMTLAEAKIEWDGQKLSVPQHCREEQCTDFAARLRQVEQTQESILNRLDALEQRAHVSTTSTKAPPVWRRYPTRQCYVGQTTADAAVKAGIIASNNMRLDNPIFNGGGFWGVMSLPECKARCAAEPGCVAIEWSDGGNMYDSDVRKHCAGAWGCTDTSHYWGGGTAYTMY